MNINVSISAYNDADLLAGCLESVRSVLPITNIVVVDGKYETWPSSESNSTDETPEIAREYGAEYDPAGPFPRECDKHKYRANSLPADEWVLLLDADERLRTFDTDILDDDTPYQPRIVNAKVYHERTPVAYWPRLHKPEWINHINRWDAYMYDTSEPPRTDRITIIHRHDLRSREYRESKYERFENEDRTGRYVTNGFEDEYYTDNLPVEATECPNCGRESVTWTPWTSMDTEEISRVGVCTAGDDCYTTMDALELDEWRYLPGEWEEGLREDPKRLQLECVDAGWGYAAMSTTERFQTAGLGLRRWIEKEFGREYADLEAFA